MERLDVWVGECVSTCYSLSKIGCLHAPTPFDSYQVLKISKLCSKRSRQFTDPFAHLYTRPKHNILLLLHVLDLILSHLHHAWQFNRLISHSSSTTTSRERRSAACCRSLNSCTPLRATVYRCSCVSQKRMMRVKMLFSWVNISDESSLMKAYIKVWDARLMCRSDEIYTCSLIVSIYSLWLSMNLSRSFAASKSLTSLCHDVSRTSNIM